MMLPKEADAVFEGGGVKGIAFAGAIRVAEAAGVREWKNLAGTSAGATAACFLAVGYHANKLDEILSTGCHRFADYGRGGLARGVITAVPLGCRPPACALPPARHRLRPYGRAHAGASA
jgi:hypothetical protein